MPNVFNSIYHKTILKGVDFDYRGLDVL